MLGIIYWTINITHLIKESLVMVEYYFRYLLSQDASAVEQIQVVETVLSCLVAIVIAIFLALGRIVLMCIVFRQEKSLLTPHVCANCQNKNWQKKRLNQAICVGVKVCVVMPGSPSVVVSSENC